MVSVRVEVERYVKALVRERRDIILDALAIAVIVLVPLILLVAENIFGVIIVPLIGADVITILTIAIVVLALNLVAGYTGIPHFGLHLFVYLGAFGMSAVAIRLYIALVGFADEGLRHGILSDDIIARYASSIAEVVLIATERSINPRISSIVGSHAGSSAALALLYVLLGLLSSIIVSLLFALILGIATLRLKGDYFAIFSLILAELMIAVIFHNAEILGGGVYGVSAPRVLPASLESLRGLSETLGLGSPLTLVVAALLAATLIAVYFYAIRVSNSPLGRLLRGIRDDELVVSMFGRETGLVKIKVLVLGCVIASLAGALYTMYYASVIPRSFNRMDWTFLPWTMMIVGGIANNRGVVLGALLVYILRRMSSYVAPSVIEALSHLAGLPLEYYAIDQVKAVAPHIVTGILVILMLYLRPQGLLPEEPSKTLRPRVLSGSSR